ncbi:MAG: EamA family transporter, partial [Gemmatimonadaceae bacterium]
MKATRTQLALGFLCIYVLWGSTYLAIRFAVATIPPFIMGGVRFIIAGSLLYGWSRLRGGAKPTVEQWKNAFIIGFLLLLIGNGAVAWSEQRVSSGMTSLLVATMPLWLVLAELYNRRRPQLLQWVAVAAGLIGVALLVLPTGSGSEISPAVDPIGAVVLMIGSLSWTIGSLFARTAKLASPQSLASGMQMLCGGALMLSVSLVSGEWTDFHASAVTSSSMFGLLYLVFFGSIIGFSTYMWLLSVAKPAAVGTYAYVNPVVAVLLGVVIGGETYRPRPVS